MDPPSSFRFDESTTSQIKKQHDAYTTYQSNHLSRIMTKYLRTLFVGKCTAEDLLHHLHEMIEKLKLNVEAILTLGMDGPSVNLLFQRNLEKELEKKNKQLIEVGTCPLHTVSNAFLEGLKALAGAMEIDLDQFVLNLFVFFICQKIKDYFDVQSFTEVQGRRMMKYVATR